VTKVEIGATLMNMLDLEVVNITDS